MSSRFSTEAARPLGESPAAYPAIIPAATRFSLWDRFRDRYTRAREAVPPAPALAPIEAALEPRLVEPELC